ncbi:MAG: hypothetical protein QHH19_06395 [Candidatus Thermoplasmatota archaeon]|jgi:hypothetical protein|nr:hypothetical protein [Candidatus Thermoplasmatota archaeon]
MSIKKELLNELTESQLKELAENKGIKINLSERKKRYYADWNEKDKLADIMNDIEDLTVKDIEEFIRLQKNL